MSIKKSNDEAGYIILLDYNSRILIYADQQNKLKCPAEDVYKCLAAREWLDGSVRT